MTRKCLYWLDDELPQNANAIELLGSKGASLRKLYRSGVFVPNGFTIVVGGDQMAGFENQLREATKQLVAKQSPSPTGLLAVRSGAAISMPGLLDTRLDVTPEFDSVLEAVRQVFDSFNSKRARVWREARNLCESSGTAVTVQHQIAVRMAGVVFTRNPDASGSTDSNWNELVVEYVPGRGDRLVAGTKTPTRVLIDRTSLESTFHDPSNDNDTENLSGKHLTRLASHCLDLECAFGESLDIEWGCTADESDGEVVFFQARPIQPMAHSNSTDVACKGSSGQPTTLPNREKAMDFARRERSRIADLLAAGRHFVRHNLSESLPHPTPMTWAVIRRMMSGRGGFIQLYQKLGFSPSRSVREFGFLRLIAGKIYSEPDRMRQLLAAIWPFHFDCELLKQDAQMLNHAPNRFHADETHPLLVLLWPYYIWLLVRSRRRLRKLTQTADQQFLTRDLPVWLDWVEQEWTRDLPALDDQSLLEVIQMRIARTTDDFAMKAWLPGTLGAIGWRGLEAEALAKEEFDSTSHRQFRHEPSGAIAGHLHERQTTLLQQLSEGQAVSDQFVSEFGHRGHQEMELSAPTWRECPPILSNDPLPREYVCDARIDRRVTRDRIQLLVHEKAAQIAASMEAFISQACTRQDSRSRQEIATVQRLLPFRETGRHFLLMGFELIRQSLLEFGRRHGLPDDVFFLTPDELQPVALNQDFSELIEKRKADHLTASSIQPPDFLDQDSLKSVPVEKWCRQFDDAGAVASFGKNRPDQDIQTFQGESLVRGTCEGQVVRVENTQSSIHFASGAIAEGSIIVTESLTPGHVPLLLQATGVIVAVGGQLSHGAIIARQLNVPVIRSSAAYAQLANSQHVRIANGEIHIGY